MERRKMSLLDLFGKQYKAILQCKKRYLVLKGSRASKKSKNIALRWILLLYEYSESNLLVVRKYSTLLKQSCRADLIWAIKRLGVESDWSIPKGEMTLTRRSTGQVILFRGATEPDSIASITVEAGVLNFAWVEEAYQIEREADFDMIDESIRGQLPKGYFKQIVLTFNPWHESSWLRKRFYVMQDGEQSDDEVPYIENTQKSTPMVLATTRNYTCNEWLDKADIENFERMKREQPQRYRVAGLGEWGVSGSTIYDNWQVVDFKWKELYYEKDPYTGRPRYEHRIGLDFGYSHNTAGVRLLVDQELKEIYVCQELYEQRLSTDEIYKRLTELDWAREPIHADSEAPMTIADLRKMGCSRMFGVKKAPGSVASGIQKIRGYKILISPECENFQIEISHYAFKKDASGRDTNVPLKEWDHLMDAMRYALMDESAGIEFVNNSSDETMRFSATDQDYRKRLDALKRRGVI